jgi:hypothetical protein
MFVEDLLLDLENAAVGFHLGNIYICMLELLHALMII